MGSKQRNEEKARKSRRQEILSKVSLPANISIMRFDSQEWQRMLEANPENNEIWKKARGIVHGLVNGRESLSHGTFESLDAEEIKSLFLSIATQDADMSEIEIKHSAKFGDYRVLDYNEWSDNVHQLWCSPPWSPDNKILNECIDELSTKLADTLETSTGLRKLSPLSIEEIWPMVPKNKHSGWPYFTSKWSDNQEMVTWYKDQASRLINGEDTLTGCPHILFKRVQPGGMETPKMRPVECPPKHDAIAAKCFTEPMVRLFKTIPEFYGFNGGENVHKIVAPFMSKKYLIEGDFSSFDARCQLMMNQVFKVLMKITPQKYWRYLQICLNYYQNSILITPIGVISGKDGKINGLNSGDGWTSVIGTLSNALAVRYSLKRMGIDNYLNLAFGDDIAIATDSEFDTVQFENCMDELGMLCNRSKQGVQSGEKGYFSFLGYYHFRHLPNSKGKFPIMRLAPGLVWKENYTKVEQVVSNLSIDIDEEDLPNCNDIEYKGVRLLGFAMKLNVANEHGSFTQLMDTFIEHEPDGMDLRKFIHLSKLESGMKSHRTSRSSSIIESKVVRYLMSKQEQLVKATIELEKAASLDKPVHYPFCIWPNEDAKWKFKATNALGPVCPIKKPSPKSTSKA